MSAYEKLLGIATEINHADEDDLKSLTVSESQIEISLRIKNLDEQIKAKTESTKTNKEEAVAKLKKEKAFLEMQFSTAIATNKPGPSATPQEGQKLKLFFKETPKFGGKSKEDFQRWLYEIKRSIKIIKLTDEEAYTAIGFKLEGGPFEQHRHYTERAKSRERLPYSPFS